METEWLKNSRLSVDLQSIVDPKAWTERYRHPPAEGNPVYPVNFYPCPSRNGSPDDLTRYQDKFSSAL